MCPRPADSDLDYLSRQLVRTSHGRIFESEVRLLRCEQRLELSKGRILIALCWGVDGDVATSKTRHKAARDESPPQNDAQYTRRPPGWPDLSHLTVLVVEDDKDNRDMLIAFLSSCSATVRSASTASGAALHLDSSSKIDLLITDVRMRKYSGRKLAQWVREHPKRSAVPIIAVSGSVREPGGDGYDVFLLKPVNFDELVATILRVTSPR